MPKVWFHSTISKHLVHLWFRNSSTSLSLKMAESIAIPKTTYHVRSISLPSRSHPLTISVEDHLCRLKVSETSTSASSICHNLDGLKNLYECVNDLLQLPRTQQAISHEQPPHDKWAEEVLDGSLRLLDVCSTARDVLLQTKESVQQLESSLRRRRSAESSLTNEVGAYMVSRKKVNKMITKCITNLNFFEKKCTSPLLEKDSSLLAVVSVLREVEAISLSTMKSLLCSVSGTKATSNKNGWSLVSKLMQPKRVTCVTEEEADISLSILNIRKLNKDAESVQNVMKQLETSEMAIQELEDGLESVYRCLVKTRVSLLNILNH